MKRRVSIALALVAALALGALLGIKVGNAAGKYASQKRESLYQSTLASYTRALRPGLSRQEVESYLRARDVVFGNDGRVPNADITLIGAEAAPWYCDEEDVYISFLYSDDALKSINMERRLGQCL